jgi:hypothetical protein
VSCSRAGSGCPAGELRGGELVALTQGWLNLWYAALYMPFVGVERDRIAQVATVLLTAYFLVDVLPL